MRKAKGLTIEQVAAQAGLSQSFLSRLEQGKRTLVLPTAEKLAGVFGVKVAELLDIEPDVIVNGVSGFADDCTPYIAPAGDPIASLATGNQYLFSVDTDVVDRAGLAKGDIARIDIDAQAVKRIKPLDIVQVRLHPEDDFHKPLTLLRQFVPPRLLITNSGGRNLPSVNMDEEDAHIVGVVVGSYKRFG